MVLDCSKLEKALRKKGFKFYSGGKHKKYIFECDGVKTGVCIEISHNNKDIRDTMINILTREMHFNDKSEFIKYYECSLKKEDYKKILIDNNVIRLP